MFLRSNWKTCIENYSFIIIFTIYDIIKFYFYICPVTITSDLSTNSETEAWFGLHLRRVTKAWCFCCSQPANWFLSACCGMQIVSREAHTETRRGTHRDTQRVTLIKDINRDHRVRQKPGAAQRTNLEQMAPLKHGVWTSLLSKLSLN